MPCDGKNPNCSRRRELLAQLKCLISLMDKKKPCEWDEPSSSPIVYCPPEICCAPLSCIPDCRLVKPCKSFELRASTMYRCECIKRNGLQDRCMIWDCMGRPECMTKLYPVCEPGRAALLKLTDFGDVEVALDKFYHADRLREAALAQYCRLACDNARMKQILSCGRSESPNVVFCTPPTAKISDCNAEDSNLCKSPCDDPLLCAPSQACPKYILQSSGICCPYDPVLKLEEPPFPCNLPPLPYNPPPFPCNPCNPPPVTCNPCNPPPVTYNPCNPPPVTCFSSFCVPACPPRISCSTF